MKTILIFLSTFLAPAVALAQEATDAIPGMTDAVPGWLPVLATCLMVLAYILRALKPALNEHVDAMKRSKIDDMVFDAVSAISETSGKAIREKVADGTYSKEKGRELLMELGMSAVQEIIKAVGANYMGSSTEAVVAQKLERAVSGIKLQESLTAPSAALKDPTAP